MHIRDAIGRFARFCQKRSLGLKNLYWICAACICLLVVTVIPAVVLTRPKQSPTTTVRWMDIVTAHGDRLPDFSYCGYHAGEAPLPAEDSSPAIVLQPQAGDNTAQIQYALNATAEAGGGVVSLAGGQFAVMPGLVVPGGVVLRGGGAGLTTLTLSQLGQQPLISIGRDPGTASPTVTVNIVDEYVPIGTSKVTVDDATGLASGQAVFIQRAVTASWVRDNGMGDLVRDGVPLTWLKVGTIVRQPRIIKSVQQNTVTLTVPLTDALDTNYMQPALVAYNLPNVSAEAGIEGLSIVLSPTCSGTSMDSTTCNAPAISFESWTVDSWARDLQISGFNNFFTVQENSTRITIEKATLVRDAATTGTALPGDIIIDGSQVLVADCVQMGPPTASSFAVMTGSLAPGPNAVLRHSTESDSEMIFPHQRWAHGFLVEDTAASTHLINRGTNGTGHGWAINAGVGWNLRGYSLVQSPPLGVNWCIGCSGTVDSRSNGSFVSSGQSVIPTSLFEDQLRNRVDGA